MNVAGAIAFAAAAVAIYSGALALRFATAPGWRALRWFATIAFGSAGYALCNLGTTLHWPDAAVTWLSRFQLSAALVQLWAWYRYADATLGRTPSPLERRLTDGILGGAALALVPGLVYDGRIKTHAFAPFGATYRDAVPTTVAELFFAAGMLAAVVVLWRLGRAWRRGVPYAGLHVVAFAALLVMAVNDSVAATGAWAAPYLLDVGFFVPVGAVAWSLTSRFAEDARALEALRTRLETVVEDRTRELARTQAALHEAEKLASLGQFAAGVAHEVNNPASVVTANLHYLVQAHDAGGAPVDAGECLEDALASMKRINDLVRRLVDAGKVTGTADSDAIASVDEAVRQSLAEVHARAGHRVRFRSDVPDGLRVKARLEVVTEVVGQLLANAADAVPESGDGRVVVRAERSGGGVRITVEDDGAGMPPDVLRRVFEPFFTTKGAGAGAGSGLGLPVSRGLAESHGGELRLESAPGKGTRAILELPEAAA
jgi:signal transduction histidine kinase